MPLMRQRHTPVEHAAEVIVSSTEVSAEITRAFRAGKLRRLAWRVYTWNHVEPAEDVVRRNLWDIVAGLFPGALVADRTALEASPASDGSVCLISPVGKAVQLPGHVLRPRRGVPPLPSDPEFTKGLWMCSNARAFLENLRQSRSTRNHRIRRTLPERELKDRLNVLIQDIGGTGMDQLWQDIEARARDLDMLPEGVRLQAMLMKLRKQLDRTDKSRRKTSRQTVCRRTGQIPISFVYNPKNGIVPKTGTTGENR